MNAENKIKNTRNIALIGTSAVAAIQFRSDLIGVLVAQGHRVSVWSHDFDEATRKAVRDLGADPCDSPLGRSNSNPFKDIIATFKMAKILKQTGVNTVLSYFIKPVVFGTLAAVIAGIQSRYAMIEGLGWAFSLTPPDEQKRGALLRFIQLRLMSIALPFARSVIFLNEDDQSRLVTTHNIRIGNSVLLGAIGAPEDFFEASPVPINPMRFVFVARLLFDKGIRDFIAAAKMVKAKYPEACFDIYGTIDAHNPRSLSADDIESLSAEGFVTFHGYQSDMKSIYHGASCLVAPSTYGEGFPRTIQEAMAMSRPAIVCDVPGSRQGVIDGETGFVVPAFAPDALAKSIQALINDPSLLQRMGKHAHAYAKLHYDGKIQAEALAALILDSDDTQR